MVAVEPSWLYLPVLLAVAMGMRRSEILGLTWQDIDFNAETLTVRPSVGKGGVIHAPKTPHSRRTISVPPLGLHALRQQKARQAERRLQLEPAYQNPGLVIAQEDGRPSAPVSLTHAFRKVAKREGLTGLRFHDLRHTSARLLLASGVDMKTVSSRLGHSSATTTLNIYAHTLRETDQRAARKMDQILGKAAGS